MMVYNQQQNMNKNVSKIILFTSAFLIGGCTLFGTAPKQGSQPTPTPVASSQKSLKDLFASGISQKCTFMNNEGETNTRGTVYAANGKSRADFSSVTSGQTVNSHMIVDGKTNYVWMDGQNKGIKSTFDPNQTSENPETADTSKDTDLNKEVDYACTPWIPDESLFKIPSDVEFTDMSALLIPSQSAGSQGSQGKNSSQCAACDSLTGDTKTQCLSALNCE